MKNIKMFVLTSIILTLFACQETGEKNLTTQDNTAITELNKNPTEAVELILKEKSLGNFELVKGMPLDEAAIKKAFSNEEVTKNIGEQDGPNFYYYKIGTKAILNTPDTKNEILVNVYIKDSSTLKDEYGIKIGDKYLELSEKRPDMKISTEHFHVYLYKENSNIAYEITIPDYTGPDKDEYTLEDIKNSEVISIIWK